MRSQGCLLLAFAGTLALALCPGAALAAGPGPDCDGPAPDAQPDTPAWTQREQDNDFCGEQRAHDTSSNPAFSAAVAALPPNGDSGGPPQEDPFRDPALLPGVRLRSPPAAFTAATGHRPPRM